MITEGKITLITKSYTAEDILSLADLKLFVFKRDGSIAPTITDNELTLYRNSCIEKIENIINTSIIKSDYKLELYGFHNFTNPYYNSKGFIIKKPHIKEISSIKYLSNNILTDLDSDIYFTVMKIHSYVFRNEDLSFPEVDTISNFQLKSQAVQVLFKSGLFEDVASISSTIKEAIASYVIEKYNGCDDESNLIASLKNTINQYAYVEYSDWYNLYI